MALLDACSGELGVDAILQRSPHLGQWPRITVPTLITVGDEDGTTRPDLARRWLPRFPARASRSSAEQVIWALLEQPEAMTRELVAWLSAD